MTMFFIVSLIFAANDFLIMLKQKHKKAFILYFTCMALAAAGAVLYFTNSGSPDFADAVFTFFRIKK